MQKLTKRTKEEVWAIANRLIVEQHLHELEAEGLDDASEEEQLEYIHTFCPYWQN